LENLFKVNNTTKLVNGLKQYIYFDNNSTTPTDPGVLEAMIPFLSENFVNPSSTHHFGIQANEAVKKARVHVVDLIGAKENEILFKSGATESINILLKGVSKNYSANGKNIIAVSTEHYAMLDTCKYFETIGYDIKYCLVSKEDIINCLKFKMLYQ
jgi:cysteine desulfurase